MSDNYPPGISDDDIDRQFGAEEALDDSDDEDEDDADLDDDWDEPI